MKDCVGEKERKAYLYVVNPKRNYNDMTPVRKITVTDIEVSVSVRPDSNDYICLTDMAHFKDKERTNYIIQNWMRLRSTIDFLGL